MWWRNSIEFIRSEPCKENCRNLLPGIQCQSCKRPGRTLFLPTMTSDWLCHCCRVIFITLLFDLHQQVLSSRHRDDSYYPLSGPDATNYDCQPAPQRVLLRQLGSDSHFGRRRRLSLSGSRKSHRHLTKQLTTRTVSSEGFAEHYDTDIAQMEEFLTETLSNASSHEHRRRGELREPSDEKTRRPSEHRNRHRHRSSTSLSSALSDTVPLPFRQPPWKCEYQPRWVKMADDIFPPYVQSGDCQQTECFFGMYQCKPQKYVIKVLKRKKNNGCHPLPVEGISATYEEAWEYSMDSILYISNQGPLIQRALYTARMTYAYVSYLQLDQTQNSQNQTVTEIIQGIWTPMEVKTARITIRQHREVRQVFAGQPR